MSTTPETAAVIAPEALLEHWQGHRRLTRRVIDAFPEDQLFTFSLGGMRPFGAMAMEMLVMAAPMVRGVVSEDWTASWDRQALPKADLLREWDEATAEMNALWRQIPLARFQETTTAFGQFPGKVHDLLLYVIDNEIHHRGQGYVYLRALGIEPPPFYERTGPPGTPRQRRCGPATVDGAPRSSAGLLFGPAFAPDTQPFVPQHLPEKSRPRRRTHFGINCYLPEKQRNCSEKFSKVATCATGNPFLE